MALTPGTRLGVYEVTAQIGEGGMGQVYRATDTRLKRQVAIKILPPSLSADAERLLRFQREAEVLASLNHPHIATIYGFEDASLPPAREGMAQAEAGHGPVKALVMELVEGDDLSLRIARGAIPLDEALPIARQICEALEAAHEQGIIHRDLKPANIKVRADGAVKVLDFGLAKALDPEGSSGTAAMNSPTITTPAMTRAGVILGTAAYMSPEQARGRTVDKRADIWAIGCVLFEMLTGTRAFPGEDLTDTLAAVVRADPDWTLMPSEVSPTLVAFIRRCLEKEPRKRIQAVGDLRLALEGAFETSVPYTATRGSASRPRTRSLVGVAGLAGLAGALVGAAILSRSDRTTPEPAAPTRMSVMLPADRPISIIGYPTRSLALSPDGTQIVYTGLDPEASSDRLGWRSQLQLRSLGSLAVRDLPATNGARQPFFSPSGEWVGFFTGAGELKKISLAGGNPVTLVEGINGSGLAFGVWTPDDTIIVGTISSPLRRVSAEGGELTDLTTLDAAQGELFHQFPALVSSNRAVLFTVHYTTRGRSSRIEAVMLDSGERRVVLENARAPFELKSGHLLFQRDETILVAPFDRERLTVTGPAVPLVAEVRRDSPLSPFLVAQLAVSSNGTLAYVPAVNTASVLGLVSRRGVFDRLGPPDNNFDLPRVSPDGHAVAFVVARGPDSDVHVFDLVRGSTTKLKTDGTDSHPAWLTDSRSLAISSRTKNASGIFLKALDGRERPLVPLPAGVTQVGNASWSPDGTRLAYTAQTGMQHDIWVLTTGDAPTTQPFLTSSASEHTPRFSPDGQWLAYASDESGRSEVYIQKYPQGERLAVSTGGGRGPVWSRDGKELFFQGSSEGTLKLMAVAVTPDGASLRLAKPVPLFDMRVPGPTGVIEQYAVSGNHGAAYDILPDGRFVMIKGADPTGTREVVLIQHWFEELKRLVPTR